MKIGVIATEKEDLEAVYAMGLDSTVVFTSYAGIRNAPWPVFVFEQIEDMNGYMRGLEDYLKDCDMVLAIEATRLASFQAARYAQKNRIPFIVYSSEKVIDFYANYRNVLAMRHDILESAAALLVPSDLSKHLYEITLKPKIHLYAPQPKMDFRFDVKKRDRFRKHVALPIDKKVFVVELPLDQDSPAKLLIEAIAILKERSKEDFHCVFIGAGEKARELKLQVIERQLQSTICFLHENVDAYRDDLYSAADVVIHFHNHEENEGFPYAILDAAYSGAVLALSIQSPVYKQVSHLAHAIIQSNLTEVIHVLSTCLDQVRTFEQRLHIADNWSVTKLDLSVYQGPMLADYFQLATMSPTERLKILDSIVLPRTMNVSYEKGLALYQMQNYELAIDHLHNALQLNPNHEASYVLLGDISLRSHSHEEAITFYKRVLGINQESSEALLGIGVIHLRLGLYDQALHWFERSITTHKNYPSKAISLMIQACRESHNKPHVSRSLERVMEYFPEDSSVLLSLGQTYLDMGRHEQGNDLINRAIAIQNKTSISA
jgi:tetratricopeptide (TPR) repeat protein